MAAKPPLDPHIYQLLVEQVKDYAVFVLDLEGRIATWNIGAQRIKGYAPEEIIGRHFSVFYTPEALKSGWPAQELKIAAREGRLEDEGWRVRKDGTRFWASVTISALRDEDGKLLGFSKITRDLTDRKMHEEALRQSEERFRLLVESVTDYAIFILDPDGIVTSWNTGAQRIKGYAPGEILGRHFSAFYTAEDIEAGKPWDEIATARRTGRAQNEGWRLKKNGERFWARVVLTPIRDEGGRLLGFAKVTQDLTERRHLEELEQTAQNVSEFIAVLSHELRNPLAPIRAAVEVMAKAPPGDPAHEVMRQTIDRQSAQLVHIADDMIDISRISRGMLRIEHVPVGVADAVRQAIETARPFIERAGHTLEVEIPDDSLQVRGDIHRLTQLLANLLNNAARYTPAGGRITVSAIKEGGSVVFRVRDTGHGVEPEMQERIFGMFVQGRAPKERVGGGLGIGLALARRLAELHGGSLEVRSEGENKGSEFSLRLPLAPGAEATKAPAGIPVAPLPPAVPRKVLIVDDNADAALALDMLLKSIGHETRVAYEGLEALNIASEFRPDIVLLDIGMPGIDGYEVARRLRQFGKGQPMRIIAITGWGKEEDRLRSREAGFDLHLVKPVDLQELARILNERNGATLH